MEPIETIAFLGDKEFSICLRPKSLNVLGTCDVKKQLIVASNGYKTLEYTLSNIKFNPSLQESVITAIGYVGCNKMSKGVCYKDQEILGTIDKLPIEYLGAVAHI